MSLPDTLKNFNVFGDANNWMGLVPEITPPKLARKFEDYRGGGMDGTVKLDMGADALECEFTAGGLMKDAIRQFGATAIDAVQLRFVGAYQNDGTGKVTKVEIVMRGRYEELDMGAAKAGDKNDHKFKVAPAYYKLIIDGIVEIEIDVLNMVFTVGGKDRLKEIRAALDIDGGASISVGISL